MLIKVTGLNDEEFYINTDNVTFIKPHGTGAYIEFVKRYSSVFVKDTPESIFEQIKYRELYQDYE